MKFSPRTLATSLVLTSSLFAATALAGPTVSITNVTWGLGTGGVGTFTVTVQSTAPVPAGAVFAMGTSAGATSIQAAVPASTKLALSQKASLKPTASGRCYRVYLEVEPDSKQYGIIVDPKFGSRNVCLDPDGGIVPAK